MEFHPNLIGNTMPAKTKRQYTRLSVSDWSAIIAQYQTGMTTVKELATKYHVSVSSIMNQAKARAVSRRPTFPAVALLGASSCLGVGALPALLPVAARAASALHSSLEDRIKATNDDVYLDVLSIQHLLRMSVAALSQPTTPAEAAATVRAAEMAITTLDRCNKVRRTILRLDKDNRDADLELPELPITVMTNLEEHAIRAQQEREDKELGIETPGGAQHIDEGDQEENDIVDEGA